MPRNSLNARQAALPSVDRVLGYASVTALAERHGRANTVAAVRAVLADIRAGHTEPTDAADEMAARCEAWLEKETGARLKRIFNLTGTVLHTNLGRAILPREAIEAAAGAMAHPVDLEFDVEEGGRGERDDHVRDWLRRLTGAEDATVVNNNAAAVFLLLNTLALGREVPVSRGELIEIGGAFRMPDIMARAGCRLREVGTTNRTHLRDFEQAIGPETAMLLKVHTSNYEVRGFTAMPSEADLAALAHRHKLPFANDLGSGTLVDLRRYDLPHEPTPQEALAQGADLVTFSGDKLLGGPQVGIVVGKADLIAKLNKNPLKRAMRIDKMRMAALQEVLRLYSDPDRLAQRLPTLKELTRSVDDIRAQAERLLPAIAKVLVGRAKVEMAPCKSQIGSGSLPVEVLPSMALVIVPQKRGRGSGTELKALAAAFRALPMPVVGRIEDGALRFDLRCLDADKEEAFVAQLWALGA